jgi:propanol-preferring alcohol dehydrogenase
LRKQYAIKKKIEMKEMMKAARLHKIGEELRIDRVPIPEVGVSDVLIKIKASGICHSDLNYRNGVGAVARLPITLGHEMAGTVTEVGDDVRDVTRREKACVHYVLSCGECVYCKAGKENLCEKYKMIGKDVDGGFAEYVKVPARNMLKLSDATPFEQGALLGCAVSTAFHALKRARVRTGDTVLVYGVGGVGIHAVQLASKIFHAGKVIAIDKLDEKLELARKLGADDVVNGGKCDPVKRVEETTGGKLADVVLEFIGLKVTMQTAMKCLGKGGRMVMVGIGPDDIVISPYKTIIGKEIELIGADDHLKSEMAQLIDLMSAGKIDLSHSITHRLPLEDVNTGFEILSKGIGNPLRVVLVQ